MSFARSARSLSTIVSSLSPLLGTFSVCTRERRQFFLYAFWLLRGRLWNCQRVLLQTTKAVRLRHLRPRPEADQYRRFGERVLPLGVSTVLSDSGWHVSRKLCL